MARGWLRNLAVIYVLLIVIGTIGAVLQAPPAVTATIFGLAYLGYFVHSTLKGRSRQVQRMFLIAFLSVYGPAFVLAIAVGILFWSFLAAIFTAMITGFAASIVAGYESSRRAFREEQSRPRGPEGAAGNRPHATPNE
jgi:hypothetical protein